MARKFDLGGMMEVVSKLDTSSARPAAPEVRMIPLADIVNNKANFYAVDKTALKSLADSIAMDGLQQYPLVMPHPSEAGKYILLSGHRRCAAIRQLVDEGLWEGDVPCTVRAYQSAAMAELQLILANSTARVLTNAEISKQAARMEILLYQLKEEGYEFPGRMRDQVAAACNVSAPKLARLKVIREKLKAPEFLLLFEKDRLPEQTAYALARLPEEFQQRLAGISTDISASTAETVLRKYGEGWRWEPDMQCPDGKGCRRGDAFLRHDLENPYDMCGGEKCCMDCELAARSYSSCSRMCSKAQAVRKEQREEKEARANTAALKQTRQFQEETQENAQRVLRAIDAAGLPDEADIPWGYSPVSAGEVRRYAAGEFSEDGRWYGARLEPQDLLDPAGAARVLGCSADFLLGLADELTPGAAPMPESKVAPILIDPPPVPSQDRENLNRLRGLLLREEKVGSDAAGALRWAIAALERMFGVDVSDSDTFAEGGEGAS